MKKVVFLLWLMFFSGMIQSQHENLQEMLNRKQFKQIVSVADKLGATGPVDWQTMFILGQAYEGLMNYREAYNCYQTGLSIDSTQVESLISAARMATSLGRINEAEAYYLKMWAADTTDFYANIQLARFYVQIGNDEEAIAYYEYLLEVDPDNPGLLKAAGDCYYRLNERFNAIKTYWHAFQFNKENAGLASSLVNTILPYVKDDGLLSMVANVFIPFERWFEGALDVCDTALYYNPGNFTLIQNKGTTLFTIKKYQEADSLFSYLLAHGDSAYYNLKYGGCSKYYLGRNIEAIDLLELAFAEDSTAVDVCLLLGSAYGRSYDRKKALQLFELVESLLKPNQSFMDLLTQFRGDTYARDGNMPEAYKIWLITKDKNLLANIWNTIGAPDVSKIDDEDKRSRSMFLNVLAAREMTVSQNNAGTLKYVRTQLERFKEEMFFRSLKEYPMIAPDNKKSTITVEQLDTLIKQL